MNRIIIKTLLTAIAVLFAAYILNGVSVQNSLIAIVVAAVLGLLNAFIKPILIVLTIPLTIFTLGLFLIVINILIVKMAAGLVPGFMVQDWWAALWFSLIVSITAAIMEGFFGVNRIDKK
jgi:putative membrane protein